jgi:hypothetical protein
MKLKTQHIRVAQGHNTYQLHRDGLVTWETVDSKGESAVVNLITHESIRKAKALFGDITSVSS